MKSESGFSLALARQPFTVLLDHPVSAHILTTHLIQEL